LPQWRFTLQCYSAVAENQPTNKNRMNKELSNFAARLRETISVGDDVRSLHSNTAAGFNNEHSHVGSYNEDFNRFALELFALQFNNNIAYRTICEARRRTPQGVEHWTQVPAVPTAMFKELELTCLPPGERTAIFHSSGTTEQTPSRHFHGAESLAVYEASLWTWFERHVVPRGLASGSSDLGLCILTPSPEQAPHSSLVHMFETARQRLCGAKSAFVGRVADSDVNRWGERPREPQPATPNSTSAASPHQAAVMQHGAWTLDFDAVLVTLNSSLVTRHSSLLLGTAFSFVHLLDFLEEKDLRFDLPAGSRVIETGGYKNRSRAMPKAELHALVTERLGVPPENIICEYGMSELSSQAYDTKLERRSPTRRVGVHASACHPDKLKLELQQHSAGSETGAPLGSRHFRFPPWARVQIISPETRREVADGETGLIRIFDLANVFSVMAIQTEDLGVRRGEGFELIGRAQLAEPRGCSLMSV